MNYWILPANPKKYNHIEAFEKFGYIDWCQMNNFNVGDIVYIYCARPISKIICKSVVERINITSNDKTNDNEFWINNESKAKSLSVNRFCRLRQLNLNTDSALTLEYLQRLQIKSFQSAQKISIKVACLFNEELQSDNEIFDTNETLPEGSRVQIYANRYERNPLARKRCISHYKNYKCQICGFDFEEKYGELGKEFIHIHHIVPISEIGEEYQIDPIKDLIPVCPNCHAMLHRNYNGQKVSIEELKNKLYKQL